MKPIWKYGLLAFVVIAVVQEPERFANTIERAFGGLSSDDGSFMNSFFTFTESLGDEDDK